MTEEERTTYINEIYIKRTIALNHLKSYLDEKEGEEWLAPFSYLGEYLSILFHFETLLENIQLAAAWDQDNNYWLLDEEMGMRFVLYFESWLVCRDELIQHNISLSLH